MFLKYYKNLCVLHVSLTPGQGPRITPESGNESETNIKENLDISSVLNLATKMTFSPLSEYKMTPQEKVVEKEIKESITETKQLNSQLSNEVFMGLNIDKRLSLVSDYNVGENLINKSIKLKFPTRDLEQKVSAGEIMPSDIKIIGEGTELYKRKSNGEFYNVLNGKRLSIFTGMTLSVPDQNKAENLVNETLQTKQEDTGTTEKFRNIELTQKDIKDFAAMVVAESWGEPAVGRAAVAYAILNRVVLWKKSMSQVLFQKNQFSPVSDGRFKEKRAALTNEQIQFVKDVLNGKIANPIGNATFFQTKGAEKNSSNWQRRASKLTNRVSLGNHYFRTEKKFVRL